MNQVDITGVVSQLPYYNQVGKEELHPYLRFYVKLVRPAWTDSVRVVATDDLADALFDSLPAGRTVRVLGVFLTRRIKSGATVGEVLAMQVTTMASTQVFAKELRDRRRGAGDADHIENYVADEVIVSGNLTHPPRFDYTPGGSACLNLLMAVDRPGGKKPSYPRVVAYGALAKQAYPYLRVGSKVQVSGIIRVRKPPGKRTVTEIWASSIIFLRNIDWETGDAARLAMEAAE